MLGPRSGLEQDVRNGLIAASCGFPLSTPCRHSPGLAIGQYQASMWSATRSSSRTQARPASLKLHYGERPAQRLVGYLDRTVKWHVHIQYQVHGSRDKH